MRLEHHLVGGYVRYISPHIIIIIIIIVTIRADFQQGMESVSEFKMNTVTENYWLI